MNYKSIDLECGDMDWKEVSKLLTKTIDSNRSEKIVIGGFCYDSKIWLNFCDEEMKDIVENVDFVDKEEMTFTIFGKKMLLPRRKAFYGDVTENGDTPMYRYTGGYIPKIKPWTETLKKVRDSLAEVTGQRCNHLVVNLYEGGTNHISYHRDKNRDFVKDSRVLTVSLGDERVFAIKETGSKSTIRFRLPTGSIFDLGAITNSKCKHAILKEKSNRIRLSLTYRSISTMVDKNNKMIKV